MPPFCIGYEAVGVGDYGTTAGPLNVPAERAGELAQWVAYRDLDVAVSRRRMTAPPSVTALGRTPATP